MEILPNPLIRPTEEQTPRIAQARKLVLVSSGAFGSPAILERSGIGQRARLQSLGIDVVSDLPGVGENFQGDLWHSVDALVILNVNSYRHTADHYVTYVPYIADNSAETLDGITRNDPTEIERT